MTRRNATLVGFSAVLLWSLLAVLTAASGAVPPFQLLAVSFAIGGLSLLVLRPASVRAMRQPLARAIAAETSLVLHAPPFRRHGSGAGLLVNRHEIVTR